MNRTTLFGWPPTVYLLIVDGLANLACPSMEKPKHVFPGAYIYRMIAIDAQGRARFESLRKMILLKRVPRLWAFCFDPLNLCLWPTEGEGVGKTF